MTADHLRIVDPPVVDNDDGSGGGGDEEISVYQIGMSIASPKGNVHSSSIIMDADNASPEALGLAVLMVARGATATFDPAVQMELERQILHWHEHGTA